jgi:tight adherence protein C
LLILKEKSKTEASKSMMSLIYLLVLLTSFFVPASMLQAQTCSENFEQISAQCILNNSKIKYSSTSIALNDELRDDVFFYKTAGGEYGKLRVLSTKVSKSECTLYLEAATYGGDRIFIPNSSIKIGITNNWLKDRIFLDREGASAIELIRHTPIKKDSDGNPVKDENGNIIPTGNPICILALTKGVEFGKYFDQKQEEKEIWRENYAILKYSPLVLIFIAIFIIVRLFMDEQDKFKTQEALEEADNSSKGDNRPLFIKITKPFYKRYFLPLTQGKNKQKFKNLYRQKIANAGLSKEISPEEFMALKLFMILGGPFAFLATRFIMETDWPLIITPVMGVVGYMYPDIWINGLSKKRGDQILRGMPFIVDMLALSVEAGLDFMAAIQRVIEKAPPGPLVEEFETLIKETRIGSSRAEGLRQLSWRVNIIEINSFCATLIAADSVGASIAPILKQLSNELRVKRSSRAEQLGATAATKILIPMVFFILPAVLVAIFAPILLQMMKGGA